MGGKAICLTLDRISAQQRLLKRQIPVEALQMRMHNHVTKLMCKRITLHIESKIV